MEKTSSTGNGLLVEEIGDKSNPVVVLVGGYGEPPIAWEFSGLPERLENLGYRVIWYAARGVAPSHVPPLPWSIDDMAEDLKSLVDGLDLSRVHLIGYSLGGFTVETFVNAYPESVERAVLMGAAGRPSVVSRALSQAQVELASGEGVPAQFGALTTLLTSLGSRELGNEPTAGMWWDMLKNLAKVWASEDGELGQSQVVRNWVHERQALSTTWPESVPVAVIAFEDDVLLPAEAARQWVEARPPASFTIVPGTGHGGLITQPEDTISAIETCLSSK